MIFLIFVDSKHSSFWRTFLCLKHQRSFVRHLRRPLTYVEINRSSQDHHHPTTWPMSCNSNKKSDPKEFSVKALLPMSNEKACFGHINYFYLHKHHRNLSIKGTLSDNSGSLLCFFSCVQIEAHWSGQTLGLDWMASRP